VVPIVPRLVPIVLPERVVAPVVFGREPAAKRGRGDVVVGEHGHRNGGAIRGFAFLDLDGDAVQLGEGVREVVERLDDVLRRDGAFVARCDDG